jgi:kexin
LEALKRGFESGRSIFVWAGGNGKQQQDNSNYDGYANSPYTIAIGAIDYLGHQSYYSEPGANLFAVTPSSGAGKGIVTSDLMGPEGYSQGSCTYDFGGTSSSAPLAAGIIALILQKRPELSTRDVMHIIANSGKKHTHEMGFGLLKVPQLLQKTFEHVLLTEPLRKQQQILFFNNKVIPKGSNFFIQPILTNFAMSSVEQVLVTVTLTHGCRGQVNIRLESPVSESILAENRKDCNSGTFTWTFTSVHHWGESIKMGDTWNFKAKDDTYNGYRGNLDKVIIEWWGN